MNQTAKTTSIGCLGILMKLFIDLLVHILGICFLLLIITFLGFAFLNIPLYSFLNLRLYLLNKRIIPSFDRLWHCCSEISKKTDVGQPKMN